MAIGQWAPFAATCKREQRTMASCQLPPRPVLAHACTEKRARKRHLPWHSDSTRKRDAPHRQAPGPSRDKGASKRPITPPPNMGQQPQPSNNSLLCGGGPGSHANKWATNHGNWTTPQHPPQPIPVRAMCRKGDATRAATTYRRG